MMFRHAIRSTVLAATCIALMACGDSEPEAAPEPVRPVKVVTFSGVPDTLRIEYSGAVAAALRSDMGFEVPGRIAEFLVAAGERVSAGQVLARLEPTDYQSNVDKATAERDAARADFERYRQAFEERAVTAQDRDLAQRNLEVAEASLRIAQKGLDDSRLRAPFDGQVARKLVNDYANVQAKEPVLVLQDTSSLEIEVDVPEQDWVRTRPDLDVSEQASRVTPRVEVSALPGRFFPATLKEADTTADPVTRTYMATFAFATPDDVSVRPGMTGRVLLDVPPEMIGEAGDSQYGPSIPSAAVLADAQGDAYVWRIDDDMRVQRQPVRVGELSGDDVVVLEGLTSGTRIAASGVHNLREGMQVREFMD